MISGVGAAVFLWVVWLVNTVLSFRRIDKDDVAIITFIAWCLGFFWTSGCTMYTVKDGLPIELIGLIPYIIGTVFTVLLYDVVGFSKKLVQFLGKIGP